MSKLFMLLLLGFWCDHLVAQDISPVSLGPAPRLFYIQRTGNSDTIVYDANTGPDGLFYKNKPIHIYWHRAASGKIEKLNYLQRTRGYGIKHIPSDKTNEYIFHLVSYSKRNLYLKKNYSGQPVALITISGKEAYLQRMFIQLEPDLFGLKPKVNYIELFGVDVQTGEAAYEKLKP